MTNLYDVLGVAKDCSESDIKKAYRSLSLKYHPDRNTESSSNEKFQEINAAYEVLGDPQRRQQYDMESSGHMHFGGGMPMGGDFGDINAFFEMMLGGHGGGMHGGPGIHIFQGGIPGGGMHFGMPPMFQQFVKPPPINKDITLTLEQAYQGLTIPIEIEKWVMKNNTRVMEKENIYVTIPAGIDSNESMILQDRGNIVNDMVKGDVKLNFKLENHNRFKRQGMDLLFKKTISLKESLCGFSFELHHINGQLLCLNNTTNHSIIKPTYTKVIPNMGMKRENNVGNLIIEFGVEFPDSLTEEQISAIEKIL